MMHKNGSFRNSRASEGAINGKSVGGPEPLQASSKDKLAAGGSQALQNNILLNFEHLQMGEGGSQEEYAQLEAICDNAEDD